jgi:hypothetical protein
MSLGKTIAVHCKGRMKHMNAEILNVITGGKYSYTLLESVNIDV